ncbi:class I SAM-dependent methyltransferase [Sabulicella glaciei]|uniref:Class I SAM-dependent methyltransferase n=1 Tax=Sabulicella glaciei TaxID=2984948 RepID=A0ABT3NPL8_9PROT|nr:class I SAM-dependent methyltransferase [Roseococcus sp. MDT2-1-1]MCW8084108.1 class I SAM-dependent methyltransferase [Roseococcus sp. MDT2-1-1]
MAEKQDDIRTRIAADWAESDYYDEAERFTEVFWTPSFVFRPRFEKLDLSNVIELACGRGRHAAQCIDRCGMLSLVDVNRSNIEACRRRFAGHRNVRFLVTPGNSLPDCPDGTFSALYCYDAMVHFELLDIVDYLRETRRVLQPGGRALLHVSNNMSNPGGHYHQNTHWRNFGHVDIVRHLADRLGLSVLEHEVFDWSGAPNLDAVLLLERPGA